ncbi:MAG: hypothetical protein QM621_02585 [Aeromicrobium sp.]|uniref:hypothetical protein n=1 Tax=Aeromicrobium sp. TaxID=1871063 RepID=UPI0039E5AE6D
MPTITRDRSTAAQERKRVLRSRDEFWRPSDLATSGSTTLHLLSGLVEAGELRRIRRGLYWRGNRTPLGMSYPPTELVIAELAPGPGVGPTELDASNRLRVSTQVPQKAHIAVPRRAPESTYDIDFYARPARRARVAAGLGAGEVALLEALDQWERTVELPPAEAWERFGELIRSGQLRADHLARGSETEPGTVRARLRALLESLGEHALAEQIPMPDRRTTDSALAILRSAA